MSIAKPFVFCSQHNQHQSDHWATICDCEILKWALSYQNITLCSSLSKSSNQPVKPNYWPHFCSWVPLWHDPFQSMSAILKWGMGQGLKNGPKLCFWIKHFLLSKNSISIKFGLAACKIVCSLPAMLLCYWGLCHQPGWSPPFSTQQENLIYFVYFLWNKQSGTWHVVDYLHLLFTL